MTGGPLTRPSAAHEPSSIRQVLECASPLAFLADGRAATAPEDCRTPRRGRESENPRRPPETKRPISQFFHFRLTDPVLSQRLRDGGNSRLQMLGKMARIVHNAAAWKNPISASLPARQTV